MSDTESQKTEHAHPREPERADFRTEPGKWLVNLAGGVGELAWKIISVGFISTAGIYLILTFLLWWGSFNDSEPITSFRATALKPQYVGQSDNNASIDYVGEEGPLTDVNMTIKVTLRNAEVHEFKRYLAQWSKSQSVELPIPEKQPVEKLDMKGSGHRDGKFFVIRHAAAFGQLDD